MDLNLFEEKKENDVKSVLQTTDGEKFQKIVSILCEKRKILEEKIETSGATALEEDKITLKDLIEEMRTFGISEIDYQKWLAMEVKSGAK